jgi:hypothetical protein
MFDPTDEQLINSLLPDHESDLTWNTPHDIIDSVQVSPKGQKEGTMPYSQWGEPANDFTSQFFSLKHKGDKIQFRLLGVPYKDGRHFVQNPDESWTVTPCSRINDKGECNSCNQYMEMVGKANRTGDKKLIDQAKKDARKYKVTISFYFPVISREEAKFIIFKSVPSIKDKFEDEIKMGSDVMKSDWIVMRTEKPGSDYYTLKHVDSSDTPPLTDDELKEVERYKKTDLSQIVSGSKDDEGDLAAEANVEVE